MFQLAPRFTHNEACQIADELRGARQVPVYYDQDRPEFATLMVLSRSDVLQESAFLPIIHVLVGGMYAFSRFIAPRPSNYTRYPR